MSDGLWGGAAALNSILLALRGQCLLRRRSGTDRCCGGGAGHLLPQALRSRLNRPPARRAKVRPAGCPRQPSGRPAPDRHADVRHRPGDLLQPLLETVLEPRRRAHELSLARHRHARLGLGHQAVVDLATRDRLVDGAGCAALIDRGVVGLRPQQPDFGQQGHRERRPHRDAPVPAQPASDAVPPASTGCGDVVTPYGALHAQPGRRRYDGAGGFRFSERLTFIARRQWRPAANSPAQRTSWRLVLA